MTPRTRGNGSWYGTRSDPDAIRVRITIDIRLNCLLALLRAEELGWTGEGLCCLLVMMRYGVAEAGEKECETLLYGRHRGVGFDHQN